MILLTHHVFTIVTSSAQYQEAHLLLNLLLLHASENDEPEEDTRSTLRGSIGPGSITSRNPASRRLKVYTPTPASPFPVPSTGVGSGLCPGIGSGNDLSSMIGDEPAPPFTATQLLAVLRALTTREATVANFSTTEVDETLKDFAHSPADTGVAYFPLCRAMGVRAVDGMVRAGVVEIRWSNAIGSESTDGRKWQHDHVRVPDSVLDHEGGSTMLGKQKFARPGVGRREDAALSGSGGPRLVPVSPVMRYAMREVVKEWEGERNVGRDTIVRGEDMFGAGLGAGLGTGIVDGDEEGSVDDGASDYASIMESDIIEY